jgi:hypothetical protein
VADSRQVLVALFGSATPLTPVLEKLRRAGLPVDGLDVVSSFPLRGMGPIPPGNRSLYLIAIVAGLVGIGIGFFFAGGTALLYPLVTGGKAIVSIPVVAIISYETMMLLAVVLTFIAMVVKIRRARPTIPPDPRIGDAISIAVRLDDGARKEAIATLLREAGAIEVEIT